MKTFHLQIVTPDGVYFDGESHEVTVPTIHGGVSILAGHIPYVTALGTGKCIVYCQEKMREAKCSGGMLTVNRDVVRIVSSGFAWENDPL